MARILIFYHSRTGNTQKMAEAVAEGAKSIMGVDVGLRTDLDVTAEELANFDAMIVGAPTYRHDISTGIKNLLEDASGKNINMKGKIGASFGSYGWSGEAPRLVLDILKGKFGMEVIEPPLPIKDEPDETGLGRCRELGKTIAERVLGQIL